MINDPFIAYLPTIDVHGCTREEAIWKVSEFINDNLKIGKYKIIVIHGKGQGILKNEIRTYFKRDKRIDKIYGNVYNLGITILELNTRLC